MKFNSKKQYIVIASLFAMSLGSCASKDSEDDASLQAEEPVAASADTSAGETPDAAGQSPEATPATSVATDGASPASAGNETVASQASGSRVMYVKYDGVAIREKADAKSKRLGKLNRGDHVLVSIEGEWARTDDGKFIALKSLSDRGVGPNKKEATWSTGSKSVNMTAPVASPSNDGGSSGGSKPDIPQKLPKKTKASKTSKAKAADTAAPATAPVEGAPESTVAPETK